jgi:5-methyltetrahydrofolate--homocysteine methyltransferase
MQASDFIIIGENVHTTRVLTRKSPRFALKDGQEGLTFTSPDGAVHFLPIPEKMKQSQDYQEGRIKHVKLAVQSAMGVDAALAKTGQAYLHLLVDQQEKAGAHFLDVNVDEISIKPADQKAAMTWLAQFVQSASPLPLSIDSSNIENIETGMAVCDPNRERPMLNSASLERKDALDLAVKMKARVVVTAAGERGMPAGVADRVANASQMVDAALAKGIAMADIYIDPLIFPISVDKTFALHAFDAMRELRKKYGPEIHITGGFSNVSFGIPHRRAINDLFFKLAVEAGADSGIIDPVANPPKRAQELDPASRTYQLAEDVLLGRDEHCRNYIKAWRKGEIV